MPAATNATCIAFFSPRSLVLFILGVCRPQVRQTPGREGIPPRRLRLRFSQPEVAAQAFPESFLRKICSTLISIVAKATIHSSASQASNHFLRHADRRCCRKPGAVDGGHRMISADPLAMPGIPFEQHQSHQPGCRIQNLAERTANEKTTALHASNANITALNQAYHDNTAMALRRSWCGVGGGARAGRRGSIAARANHQSFQ